MNLENYILTDKDFVAIKIANDYEHKNNVEYSKMVLTKVEILLELMDSLFQQKIKIPGWQVWSEPLIIKLSFHAASMIKLFDGTSLPIQRKNKNPIVLDEPSIIILFRAILENYLTFFFLYCDKISNEEKQFRLSVWRYSGIKQRVGFEILTMEAKEKQKQEAKFLEELQKEIEQSTFFNQFNNNEKKQILKGIKPRLFNSWIDIVKLSGLKVRIFKNLYGYKSNYSHSEFISALQINSKNSPFKPTEEIHFTVFLLHLLICKTIVDLKKIFPSIHNLYQSFDKTIINEIEVLNDFVASEELENI